MDKQTLKGKVKAAMENRMATDNPFSPNFKNAYLHIPNSECFDIREYEDGNEKTKVVGYGKDSGEYGIYTHTNFIPLSELTYRELERTLNVIHE